MKTRLLFFGTSVFAVPLLRALAADARFDIVLVVTQPDRPTGRKQVLTPPAVKVVADELGLATFQPERMKAPESLEYLKSVPFDAAAVASYGQILPQSVLDLAPNKFINLHASILPAYRGASPITEAIKNGDTTAGTTVMIMDALMDHGPILKIETLAVEADDTTETLSARLAGLGAQSFGDTVTAYLAGVLSPVEQVHAQATACKLIKKEDAVMDPAILTATEMERRVRAYMPWPLASMTLHEKAVKLLQTRPAPETPINAPGTVWLEGGRLLLSCAQGTCLELVSVRPEGGNTMMGDAFFRGLRLTL